MDDNTDAKATFAIQFCASLLAALVIRDVFSKKQASALVDDVLADALENAPHLEPQFREIAGGMVAGVEMALIDLARKMGDGPAS